MPKKSTDIRTRRMMVERYMDGETVEGIAKDAGVTIGTIYRRIRDLRAEQAASEKEERIPLTQKLYNQLKEHVEKLEGIITILKIAGCTVDASLDVKLMVGAVHFTDCFSTRPAHRQRISPLRVVILR